MFEHIRRMAPDGDSGSSGGAASGNAAAGGNGGQQQQAQITPEAFAEVQKKAAEFEARYNGLNTTFQKEQEAHGKTKTRLTEVEKSLGDLQKTHEEINLKHTDLSKKFEEQALQLTVLGTADKRMKLLAREYPALVSFEVEGLLPETGPEDDEAKMREFFGKFAEKLGAIQTAAKKEEIAGAAPGASGSNLGPDAKAKEAAQAHLKAANAAALKGDTDTYNKEFNLFLQATQPKS